MRGICILIGLFLLTASCSEDKKIPGDVLPVSRMKGILEDMLEASAYVNASIRWDSAGLRETKMKVLYRQILLLHHITKDKFMYSYHYYETHPDQMQVLYIVMSSDISTQKGKVDSIMLAKMDSVRKVRGDSMNRVRADTLKGILNKFPSIRQMKIHLHE